MVLLFACGLAVYDSFIMKTIIHHSLTILSYIVLIGVMLMGIFTAMGICAAVWGEGILRTALGNPPDRSHPAFWLFLVIMLPGMFLSSFGGIPVCKLLQQYAKWQSGSGDKPSLQDWLENYRKKP